MLTGGINVSFTSFNCNEIAHNNVVLRYHIFVIFIHFMQDYITVPTFYAIVPSVVLNLNLKFFFVPHY